MKYQVFELRRALTDKVAIFDWLAERSPQGALSWLNAYDNLLLRLEDSASSLARAPEGLRFNRDIREALFKTKYGRVYRVLCSVKASEVFILRIRRPGQDLVDEQDL